VPITRIIPEFRSNDLAATEDLYCNIIGLEVSMRAEPSFVMFGSPAVPAAQLIVNDNGHVGLPPGFAIDVDDPARVDDIHAAVAERGLAVIESVSTKPWGIRRFSFVDHNGERVTIIAHARSDQT
jgi:catechol 2,3-dioxygenase-like lactoylglutathione lyase family enzyme